MKKILVIALVLFICACKKDSFTPGAKILRVTVNGRTVESFDYDEKKRLIKQNNFGLCVTNPQDEYFYSYKDNRLEKINSVIRGIYSSLAAICNPISGLHTEEVFLYDGSGRLSKVSRLNSFTEYTYNQRGFIEKKTIVGTSNDQVYRNVFDLKGNVIKQTDPQGNVIEYEYDNSPNPFYRHNPGIGTPFTMSPNNIIAGKGRSNFVRKFKYSPNNIPLEVLDDNGLTYTYHYK